MKALLMYRDRDFSAGGQLPDNEDDLTRDLELEVVLDAMADGNPFLFDVARQALLSSLCNDIGTILYRQEILQDCLANPQACRNLFTLAVDAVESRKKHWYGIFSRYPGTILHDSVELLQTFITSLRRLRGLADAHAGYFHSEGFRSLFEMLQTELSDEYFATVQEHLARLKFPGGVFMSAQPGEGNRGSRYVLRAPRGGRNWLGRLFGKGPPSHTFRLADRDESGARILSELRDRGINPVANALAQSADHVLDFFSVLATELAFYVGCLNLHQHLSGWNLPLCIPTPTGTTACSYRFQELYDPCLALSIGGPVTGNSVSADGINILIITGANQGGKSTFLRSTGLAQMMMQSGMFVAAESFSADIRSGLFTHFKREEDRALESGKLDEELARMNDIAGALREDSLVLFNESFSATNEREGSEVARQIVHALDETRVRVHFVTHLYEFAHGLFEEQRGNTMFLRAERLPDGSRTFRLVEGQPLATSYGVDLYNRIFQSAEETTD